MISKPRMTKKAVIARYVFAFIVIALGVVLELLNVGRNFLEFWSVGAWLIFVGFLMIVLTILHSFGGNRKKIIDERMEKIGHKASKITFLVLVLAAFVIMIWDGISRINVQYSLFMAHLISGLLVVYFISYKIIEKRN